MKLSDQKREACISYVMNVLLQDTGSPPDVRARIHYSADSVENGCLYIKPSGFFEKYGNPDSLPTFPLNSLEGVPLLYGKPLVRQQHGAMLIEADIIASAYVLLTRYEEWMRPSVRDGHGRFPGRESIAFRGGFLMRPVVDEYASLLRGWIRSLGMAIDEPRRNFRVLLTHDVDELRRYPRALDPLRRLKTALRNPETWPLAREAVRVRMGIQKDPYACLDEVVAQDAAARNADNLNAEVIYFFKMHSREPAKQYDLRRGAGRRALQAVLASDALIGLHSSYRAGEEPERIAVEKRALEEVVQRSVAWNRHHYLGWREIEDGWALSQAGIAHDSSLGFADTAGFRLGVCRAIPLFDPVKCCPFGITEHPLMIMDCTLDRENYMGLVFDEALGVCCSVAEQCFKHRGELVLLWHHTLLIGEAEGYHRRLYRELIRYLGANICAS